jgi:hypothetical protein
MFRHVSVGSLVRGFQSISAWVRTLPVLDFV